MGSYKSVISRVTMTMINMQTSNHFDDGDDNADDPSDTCDNNDHGDDGIDGDGGSGARSNPGPASGKPPRPGLTSATTSSISLLQHPPASI